MAKGCTIRGCGKPARSRTARWCEMHYGRWRRNGSPLIEPDRGRISTTAAGYEVVYQPGHPLADRRGLLFRHRFVLYEAIGAGSHECYWCGVLLAWGSNLHVDHCDGNRGNNRLGNLVPCCRGCNVGRVSSRSVTAWAERTAAKRVVRERPQEYVGYVQAILAKHAERTQGGADA